MLIKLKRLHDDYRTTDKFIWINPDHIVSVIQHKTEKSRWLKGKAVTETVDYTELNILGLTLVAVFETPEVIVAMIRQPS